jgi:outer membrane protease
MKTVACVAAGIAVSVCAASAAIAQNGMSLPAGVALSGGIGIIGIEGREYVFDGSGSTDVLSLLIWQSVAPVLTTSLDVTLPAGWTITGKAQVAMGGDSYMEDYDWLLPFRPGFDFDDWTDRSQHPDTNLDWFFKGSIAFGTGIEVSEGVTASVNAGLRYTDVQWAAYGGSYVYSTGAFRDDAGGFADGEPAITYRQQLPAAFLGVNTGFVHEAWTFGFGAEAGVVFSGVATDDHWMRVPPRRFIDSLGLAPTAAVSASAEFAVSDQLDVFIAGALDKVFLARAGTEWYDAGVPMGSAADAAGAELVSGTVTAGLKGTF